MLKRHLHSIAVTIVTLVALGSAGGCKENIDVAAEWSKNEMTVDGSSADWVDISTRFFPDQGAVAGMANDSSTLYLMLRFSDPRMAGLIKKTGLSLTFSTEAEANNEFDLTFRGGPTAEQMREIVGKLPSGEEADRFRAAPEGAPRARGDQRVFTCAIKDRLTRKEIPVDGTEGPQAAFGIDHGLFCYEFAVPLDAGALRLYGLGIETGAQLELTAVWGDTEGTMSASRPSGGGKMGSGGRSGGGMPPGGGGRGSQGGGARGGQRPEMPEKQEVLFKLTLADGETESSINQ